MDIVGTAYVEIIPTTGGSSMADHLQSQIESGVEGGMSSAQKAVDDGVKAIEAKTTTMGNKMGNIFRSAGQTAGSFFPPLQSVFDKVGSQFDKVTAKGTSFFSKVGAAGQLAGVGLAAGAVAVGVASIKMATSFQSSMTNLVTGAGESQSNLKMVSNGILNLAPVVGQTADALSQGMFLIESAGYHGAAGLSVLKAAAEGASVGNAQLSTMADAVTTALHDYNLPATQATNVTSALVETVASGKTHMQDLASSLGKVMPTASALGVSFQQVTGAMATMTNAGTSARLAAQHINNTLLALSAPAATAQKAMEAVGLSAQGVKTTLGEKGLSGAISLIEQHVGAKFPKSSVAYVTAMKDITGGTTGYTTALMLGGANMATFQSNVQNIGHALTSGKGQVQGFSDVQKDLKFQLDQAKAGLDAMGIKLGMFLLPWVEKAIKYIGELVAWFVKHNKIAEDVAIALGVLAAAMIAVGIATAIAEASITAGIAPALALLALGVVYLATHWKKVWDDIKQWTADAVKFVKSHLAEFAPAFAGLALLAAPLLAALAPIALIAAAAYELIKHWSTVEGFFKKLGHDIVHDFDDAVAFFKTIGDKIVAGFDKVTDFFKKWWPVILAIILPGLGIVIDEIILHWHTLERLVEDVFKGIAGFVTGVFHGISDVITPIFHGISAVITPIFDGLKLYFTVWWDVVSAIFTVALDVIEGALKVGWDVIKAAAQVAWDGMKLIFTVFWDVVTTAAKVAWDALHAIFTVALDLIEGKWSAAWGAIEDFFKQTWTAIQSFFTTIWGAISSYFTSVLNVLVGLFTSVWNTIWTTIQNIGNDIWTFLQNIWNTIESTARAIWGDIETFFTGWWNTLLGFVQTIANNIWSFLQTSWNTIETTAKTIWGNIQSFFTGWWNTLTGDFKTAWNTVSSWLTSTWDTFETTVEGIWNRIVAGLQRIWNGLTGIATGVWKNVKGAFVSGIDDVIKTINNVFINPINDALGIVHLKLPAIPLVTAAGGTIFPVGAGMVTNGPVVLAGEGRPQYPEFVIPTDPAFRSNALRLTSHMMGALGFEKGGWLDSIPHLSFGGTITGALHSATSAVGHLAGDVGGALVGAVGSLVSAVKAGAVDAIAAALNAMAGPLESTLSAIPPKMVGQLASGTVQEMVSDLENWLKGKTPAAAAKAGGPVAAVGGQPASSNAANQALGMQMAAAYGWGSGPEWVALNNVVMRESGWNSSAQNPSSSAYGIAQNIGGPAGYGPGGNTPQGQIAWMLAYIKGRYVDPIGAWAHELSAGWYDAGGYLPTGLSLALNTTGRPEPVGHGGVYLAPGSVAVNLTFAGDAPTSVGAMATIQQAVQAAVTEAIVEIGQIVDQHTPAQVR